MDENKLLQAKLAAEAGLHVAPTLCTDKVEDAVAFARQYPFVAIKPVGGFALKTNLRGKEVPLSMFTAKLSCEEFAASADLVRYCPIIIQPYIEKAFEIRLTVVGDSFFAVRIDSQATERTKLDWRNYDLANTPHAAITLDRTVQYAVSNFMQRAELTFAAIDLIVTPDEEVVFLEANPAGQFGWMEAISGLPISAGIANWLTGHVS